MMTDQNEPPKFAQLYFYDGDPVSSIQADNLDISIMRGLKDILMQVNPFAQSLRFLTN
jgi:hypothetical protein